MFTGIVADRGTVKKITDTGDLNFQLTVCPSILDLSNVKIGDSIATNGVCLTVTALRDGCFVADVSHETFICTNLKHLTIGSYVHLEKALQVSDRLDGHIVTGHVDGVGELVSIENHGKSTDFIIQIPAELSRYVAKKGSIALDGISLTVNDLVADSLIRMTIIPHTMHLTNIQDWKPGQKINIEVDLMARYIERLLVFSQTQTESRSSSQELSYETLLKNNFI